MYSVYVCILQPSRDLIPMVYVTIQDSEIHYLGQLQVVLHNWSGGPPSPPTALPLHLLIPSKSKCITMGGECKRVLSASLFQSTYNPSGFFHPHNYLLIAYILQILSGSQRRELPSSIM